MFFSDMRLCQRLPQESVKVFRATHITRKFLSYIRFLLNMILFFSSLFFLFLFFDNIPMSSLLCSKAVVSFSQPLHSYVSVIFGILFHFSSEKKGLVSSEDDTRTVIFFSSFLFHLFALFRLLTLFSCFSLNRFIHFFLKAVWIVSFTGAIILVFWLMLVQWLIQCRKKLG